MRTLLLFYFFWFCTPVSGGGGEEAWGEALVRFHKPMCHLWVFFSGLCPTAAEVASLCIPTKGLTLSPKQLEPIVELVSN